MFFESDKHCGTKNIKFLQNQEDLNEENEGVKNCRETDKRFKVKLTGNTKKECHFLYGFEWTA